MTKKNLPNIPLYVGDWERDCNVLCLESEAAWLRVVFKLWTKGKQSSIKMPTKSLQNLWRCSKEKMLEILDDLIDNEIAEIVVSERFVEFTCRRFQKENDLSEIRSRASKGVKSGEKKESKPKQNSNKSEQISENENENESEYDYNYLKEKEFEKIQIFEMQNKKSFQDWDEFIINFNSKCILEEIESPKKMLARLNQLNANWDKKPKKKNDKRGAMDLLKEKHGIN